MEILDLWSIHAEVVFGLGKNLLFKYIPERCGMQISLLRFFKTVLIFGLCVLGANFISLLQFFDHFWLKNRSNSCSENVDVIKQLISVKNRNEKSNN